MSTVVVSRVNTRTSVRPSLFRPQGSGRLSLITGDHMRAGHQAGELKATLGVSLDGKPVVKKYREIGGSFARYAFPLWRSS